MYASTTPDTNLGWTSWPPDRHDRPVGQLVLATRRGDPAAWPGMVMISARMASLAER
jgi:hypothetical protein